MESPGPQVKISLLIALNVLLVAALIVIGFLC